MHDKGWRFFADDEDLYGLEELLQALCFLEAGRAFVPAKPWLPQEESGWVAEEHLLPPAVRQSVQRFRSQAEAAAGSSGGAPAPQGGGKAVAAVAG